MHRLVVRSIDLLPMQVFLSQLIDDFSRALGTSSGLANGEGAFLSTEEHVNFRTCAVLIGMNESVLKDLPNGLTIIDPAQLGYLRRQLLDARNAIQALPPEYFTSRPIMLDEFAAGGFAYAGETKDHPELDQLLRGLHMAAVRKTPDNDRYQLLATTLSTRGEAVDAIALLRPDIALALRGRIESEKLDPNAPGALPATPKQIRDLHQSYKEVVVAFDQNGPEAAQSMLEQTRSQSQPKPSIIKAEPQGKIISRELPGGKHAVVLSTRPREESTEHFMVELDSMQPVLDLAKRIGDMRHHASGQDAKYFSSKGEFWLRCLDREQAQYWQHMLRALLQDGNGIKVEIDETVSRKNPTIWLNMPHDLLDKIREESKWLHDLRDDVRATFDQGDKEGAQKLKNELLDYARPRIYTGQHAAAVAESREGNLTMGK